MAVEEQRRLTEDVGGSLSQKTMTSHQGDGVQRQAPSQTAEGPCSDLKKAVIIGPNS